MLKYQLVFDPSEVWSDRSQFEEDFVSFLKHRGLEAEIVYINDQQNKDNEIGDKILFISKIDEVDIPKEPSSHQKIKKVLTIKRNFSGKFDKK